MATAGRMTVVQNGPTPYRGAARVNRRAYDQYDQGFGGNLPPRPTRGVTSRSRDESLARWRASSPLLPYAQDSVKDTIAQQHDATGRRQQQELHDATTFGSDAALQMKRRRELTDGGLSPAEADRAMAQEAPKPAVATVAPAPAVAGAGVNALRNIPFLGNAAATKMSHIMSAGNQPAPAATTPSATVAAARPTPAGATPTKSGGYMYIPTPGGAAATVASRGTTNTPKEAVTNRTTTAETPENFKAVTDEGTVGHTKATLGAIDDKVAAIKARGDKAFPEAVDAARRNVDVQSKLVDTSKKLVGAYGDVIDTNKSLQDLVKAKGRLQATINADGKGYGSNPFPGTDGKSANREAEVAVANWNASPQGRAAQGIKNPESVTANAQPYTVPLPSKIVEPKPALTVNDQLKDLVPPLRKLAHGGKVRPGEPFIAGDSLNGKPNPELIVPTKSGTHVKPLSPAMMKLMAAGKGKGKKKKAKAAMC